MDLYDYVSQEDIFNKYWFKVDFKQKYINPLRPGDKKPGCFYINYKNNLFFVDFGASPSTHFSCIDIVSALYNCSFKEAINVIKKDFKINYNPINFQDTLSMSIKNIENKISFIEKEECIITYKKKEFTQIDLNYWNQFGITKETLNLYNVNAAITTYINENLYHIYTNADIQYVYTEKHMHKIYRPYANKQKKWRTNYKKGILEGYNLLEPNGELLFITKSLKDVMLLKEFNCNAVAVKSETTLASNNAMNLLKSRFKNIIVFFDNDETGLAAANKFNEQYATRSFIIDKKYNVKDISDFCKKYGKNQAKLFINENKIFH
jgi:hypothetical protein